jgi:hypothetical protein
MDITIKELYRYDATYYGKSKPTLSCYHYKVIKQTKCGAWIEYDGYKKKFVNLEARKQWACATKEEALISFIARKRSQVSILRSRLDDAISALNQGLACAGINEKVQGPGGMTWVPSQVSF